MGESEAAEKRWNDKVKVMEGELAKRKGAQGGAARIRLLESKVKKLEAENMALECETGELLEMMSNNDTEEEEEEFDEEEKSDSEAEDKDGKEEEQDEEEGKENKYSWDAKEAREERTRRWRAAFGVEDVEPDD